MARCRKTDDKTDDKSDLMFYLPQLVVYAATAVDRAVASGDARKESAARSVLSWCIANLHHRRVIPPIELFYQLAQVLMEFEDPYAVNVRGARLRVVVDEDDEALAG